MPAEPERISVYQPEQEGREFPQVPIFATPAEKREHRKRRLVAACRAFAAHGLDYGHLTVRDPEFPALYWTNPWAALGRPRDPHDPGASSCFYGYDTTAGIASSGATTRTLPAKHVDIPRKAYFSTYVP